MEGENVWPARRKTWSWDDQFASCLPPDDDFAVASRVRYQCFMCGRRDEVVVVGENLKLPSRYLIKTRVLSCNVTSSSKGSTSPRTPAGLRHSDPSIHHQPAMWQGSNGGLGRGDSDNGPDQSKRAACTAHDICLRQPTRASMDWR